MKFWYRLYCAACGSVLLLLMLWLYHFSTSPVRIKPLTLQQSRSNANNFAANGKCSSLQPPLHTWLTGDFLANATALAVEAKQQLENVVLEDIMSERFPEGQANHQLPPPLQVFVVPHSHCDPAWLHTVDDYYHSKSKPILNNMLQFLEENKNFTFLWAEMATFARWWGELSRPEQDKVRNLIERDKRLELLGSNWVIPDEAVTTLQDLLEQQITARWWLNSSTVRLPHSDIYWNLDSFGQSGLTPFLLGKLQYKHAVINRVNVAVKHWLRRRKMVEFHWTPMWRQEEEALTGPSQSSGVRTSMLPFLSYNIEFSCGPHASICRNFDFRAIVGEENAQANEVQSDNEAYLAEQLYSELLLKSRLYAHNALLVPLGDDFRFDHPVEWSQQQRNWQRLMNVINSRPEWNMRIGFGTVSQYFAAVNAAGEAGRASAAAAAQPPLWPPLAGDFFVYSDRGVYDYWSGYYHSRPHLKLAIANAGWKLRATELLVFASALKQRQPVPKEYLAALQEVRQVTALLQHHDSVSGTCLHEVNEDNLRQVRSGVLLLHQLHASLLPQFTQPRRAVLRTLPASTPLSPNAPQSISHVEEGLHQFALFNSDTLARRECVRLLVPSTRVSVADTVPRAEGETAMCQINPSFNAAGGLSLHWHWLIVCAHIPALSTREIQLFVFPDDSKQQQRNKHHGDFGDDDDDQQTYRHAPFHFCPKARVWSNEHRLHKSPHWVLEPWHEFGFSLANAQLTVRMSPETGAPVSASTADNTHTALSCSMALYDTADDSGAYILHTLKEQPHENNFHPGPTLFHIAGPLLSSVLTLQSAFNISYELYQVQGGGAGGAALHVSVDVNLDTPKFSYYNNELLLHCRTAIANSDSFFTDVNGFVLARRQWNAQLPLGGNVYPATRLAVLESHPGGVSGQGVRLNVLMDAPHGVTSPRQGEVMLFLQRLNSHDDHRGNAEGVQRDAPATLRFMLVPERMGQGGAATPGHNGAHAFSPLAALLGRYYTYPATVWEVTPEREGGRMMRRGEDQVQWSHWPALLEVPCYLEVLTARLLPGGRELLLVLMKRPVTCRGWGHLECLQEAGGSEGKESNVVHVGVGQLLGQHSLAHVREVFETSLDGLHKWRQLKPQEDRITFDIADLKALVLAW